MWLLLLIIRMWEFLKGVLFKVWEFFCFRCDGRC